MNKNEHLIQTPGATPISYATVQSIRRAAVDEEQIAGLTHKFYRYPARFSPRFVASAIEGFSRPGDLVLDPYMGGGTTIVEAYALGRSSVGCDLNSLAVFIARAKVSCLSPGEETAVLNWATEVVPSFSYRTVADEIANLFCAQRTRNLSMARARPAKKLLALSLLALEQLPSLVAQDFARAILLNVAQWALHNRRTAPALSMIRGRISTTATEMLRASRELAAKAASNHAPSHPLLAHATAASLPFQDPFSAGRKADLVVTSPPYPGVHLLYHRWQVDGRKETPAPYWIADCFDGKGSAYYNFAGRTEESEDQYFSESLKTLRAIRKVTKEGGFVLQLIAFTDPYRQLSKYLANMRAAGFDEVRQAVFNGETSRFRRIWRGVPNRAWHAAQKGGTPSSREVVLIHRAA